MNFKTFMGSSYELQSILGSSYKLQMSLWVLRMYFIIFLCSSLADFLSFCAWERKVELSLYFHPLWDFADNKQYIFTHVSSDHWIWLLFTFLLLLLYFVILLLFVLDQYEPSNVHQKFIFHLIMIYKFFI